MYSVVLGSNGEIGNALVNILKKQYGIIEKDIYDGYKVGVAIIEEGDAWFDLAEIDVLHICIPWGDSFSETVAKYIKKFNPDNVVIHSSVPVGTSRTLGATHSPFVGRHPNLEASMRTFTKFLGGPNASEVADYFRRAGFDVYITDKQESTELAKLYSTLSFGVEIEIAKESKRLCKIHNLPFEFETVWNDRINEGLRNMGDHRYQRPNLIPIMKETGGHCILPNAKLLESRLSDLIIDLNKGE